MRVNYCSVDLHRSEREVIVVNKKKKKKTGNVSKNAFESRVYPAFKSIVIFQVESF